MDERESTMVVFIEDNLFENDPLLIEIELLYKNIKLFKHSQDGLDFVKANLKRRMIVVLDINFSAGEINGHEVLKLIREESKLIPVIIWSANNYYGGEDIADFINNHALFYVKKTEKTEKIIDRISEANRMLKIDLATAIEEWLESQSSKEQTLIFHGNGLEYSANDLVKEIRTQSSIGRELEENMLKLTIDLLFRGQKDLK